LASLVIPKFDPVAVKDFMDHSRSRRTSGACTRVRGERMTRA
jgi:hypothetical protein